MEQDQNPLQQQHDPKENESPRSTEKGNLGNSKRFAAEVVAAGVATTGFWVVGEQLVSHGHSTIGSILNYLAAVFFFAGLAITGVKFWPKPKLIWGLFIVFCLGLVVVFFAPISTPTKTLADQAIKPLKWEPPELLPDSKFAFLQFDGEVLTVGLNQLKEGLPFTPLPPGMSDPPDYARAFLPQIILRKNRLWVKMPVHTTFGTNGISNPFDLETAAPGYDRNYNANAFELVNREAIPTFQVVYERPNSIAVNGIFDLEGTNVENGLWITFGTNRVLAVITNRSDRETLIAPFKQFAIFRYPSWKHLGELSSSRADESFRPRPYELLRPDIEAQVSEKLRQSNSKSFVSIHAVDPDESAYAFSQQLKGIFAKGGYPTVLHAPPAYLPEVPGVSCFLYGAAAANGGLQEALQIVRANCSSVRRIAIMPYDPMFTNAEAVIMIRHN